MPFEIVKNDITNMTVDAIVYADTKQPFSLFKFNPLMLQEDGKEVLKSREKIGALATGDAKITPVFKLKAKYVVHTSAPVWHGGLYHETAMLRACYDKSFQLASKNECNSIALPIIASDNLGYPKQMTQKMAFECISDFLQSHEMNIFLVLPKHISLILPGNSFSQVQSHLKKNYVETKDGNAKVCEATISGFADTIVQWMAKKGISESEIRHKANLSTELLSKILYTTSYQPTKHTAVALGMALGLTLDEMKEFLENAGYTLSHNSKFDLIIEYCISKGIYNLMEVNQILFRFEQEQLR